MLAGELALTGVDVAIIEKRLTQKVEGSRAGGLHPRSIELLDQRGIVDRFVPHGEKHFVVPFPGGMLDASDRPSRHNYTLALRQEQIEQGLAAWVSDLSVTIHRGCVVTGFDQDGSGVDVALDDGRTLRACYLVGCDGGRSLIRKTAGIAFPGWEPAISYLIFEGRMTNEPAWGIRHGDRGIYALGPLEGGRVRGVLTEPTLVSGRKAESDALREALVAAYGTDFGVHDVTWISRFTDAARQADSYRKGRVLLAGDAAHVHSPAGGQGLNMGLQDAVSLGWKLAQVVRNLSADDLLDTYHDERYPVAAAVLKQTLALTALNRGDARTTALREIWAEAMKMDGPRQWYVARMSGLDVHYDLGDGHPLLGRRMPDLDLTTADGATTVFALLHDARPVLLDAAGIAFAGWEDRIRHVRTTLDSTATLPVLGDIDLPRVILIRPDGYVAWAGDSATGLAPAAARWFGHPCAD
jgi:3-(3-hydroxy-phenyl)propionate hydroxylase